jgi:hypothetical protein
MAYPYPSPDNPFARPTFIPRIPETEVHISVGADPQSKPPPTVKSLVNYFKKPPRLGEANEVQVC